MARAATSEGPMLIFPHVPKTGGSSVRSALKAHFGDRMLLDYDHLPSGKTSLDVVAEDIARRADELRERYSVVYGHFAADLYASLRAPVAMFFRDPIDRMCSSYHYHISKGRLQPTDVLEFVQRPAQSTVYQRFLGSVQLDNLAFVGITEEFSTSLRLFEKIFGISLPEKRERVGVWDKSDPMRSEIAKHQVANREIYDKARARFEGLCRQHL